MVLNSIWRYRLSKGMTAQIVIQLHKCVARNISTVMKAYLLVSVDYERYITRTHRLSNQTSVLLSIYRTINLFENALFYGKRLNLPRSIMLERDQLSSIIPSFEWVSLHLSASHDITSATTPPLLPSYDLLLFYVTFSIVKNSYDSVSYIVYKDTVRCPNIKNYSLVSWISEDSGLFIKYMTEYNKLHHIKMLLNIYKVHKWKFNY